MSKKVRGAGGAIALVVSPLLLGLLQFGPALAQDKPNELKIAVVQFLSGAAAPHDLSAVNTAKLLTEKL